MIKLNRPKIIRLVGLIIVDALFFSLTDPSNVKAVFLMIGFALLIVTAYYLIEGLIGLLGWYGLKLNSKKRLTYLLTGLFSVLLGLASLGQLNLKELLIIMPFFLILYIYLSYDKQSS